MNDIIYIYKCDHRGPVGKKNPAGYHICPECGAIGLSGKEVSCPDCGLRHTVVPRCNHLSYRCAKCKVIHADEYERNERGKRKSKDIARESRNEDPLRRRSRLSIQACQDRWDCSHRSVCTRYYADNYPGLPRTPCYECVVYHRDVIRAEDFITGMCSFTPTHISGIGGYK